MGASRLYKRARRRLTMLYLKNDKGVLFLTFAKKPIRLSHNWENPKTPARSCLSKSSGIITYRRQMG